MILYQIEEVLNILEQSLPLLEATPLAAFIITKAVSLSITAQSLLGITLVVAGGPTILVALLLLRENRK